MLKKLNYYYLKEKFLDSCLGASFLILYPSNEFYHYQNNNGIFLPLLALHDSVREELTYKSNGTTDTCQSVMGHMVPMSVDIKV